MTADFGGRPFSFCHYLAVRSAWERLQPELMVLHYVHLPSGPWWELARPMLALHQLPSIEGIYGFPANHPAHRADIVRLVALLVMGGVYLDTDVLVLRSFDSLGSPSFAAALEVTEAGELVGLSNAILVAEPGAPFARLCLEGHDPQRSLWQGFRSRGRDHLYVEMSVRYPGMLSGLCPGLLKVLPTASFLAVDWRPESLAALFDGQVSVPEAALALHLWESHAWDRHLSTLTPDAVRHGTSTFARLARPFLPERATRPLPSSLPEIAPQHQCAMSSLFQEVNRVDPVHGHSLLQRSRRRLKAVASRARNAWYAPLQGRLAALERQLPPTPPAPLKSDPSWVRSGSLDGSWELLRPYLPDHPCSALLISGSHGEPSACARLAMHPGVACLWVSDCLQRAAQLDRWMHGHGVQGRAVYHALHDRELISSLGLPMFSAAPAVLVCGPTPFLVLHLQAMAERAWLPGLLLLCVNPALGSSPSPAVSLHPLLTVQMPGPAPGDVFPLLAGFGYEALAASGDEQFLLYRLQGGGLSQASGQLVSPLRLQTIYADALTL